MLIVEITRTISLVISNEEQLSNKEQLEWIRHELRTVKTEWKLCRAPFSLCFSKPENAITPFSLSELHRFDTVMRESSMGASKLMVYGGRDPYFTAAVALLVACHLIISRGLGFEESFLAFSTLKKSLANPFSQHFNSPSFVGVLRAMCCAKCLNWVDFHKGPESEHIRPGQLDMEKCDHYSRFDNCLDNQMCTLAEEIPLINPLKCAQTMSILCSSTCTTKYSRFFTFSSKLKFVKHTLHALKWP